MVNNMTIKGYIEQYIQKDLKTLCYTPGLAYLSFVNMTTSLMFLGGSVSTFPFDKIKGYNALVEAIYKIKSLEKYRSLLNLSSDKDIGTTLIDLMISGLLISKNYALTERADPDGNGKHLQSHIMDDGTYRTLLVCEDMCDDIIEASKDVLLILESNSTDRSGVYVVNGSCPKRPEDLIFNTELNIEKEN